MPVPQGRLSYTIEDAHVAIMPGFHDQFHHQLYRHRQRHWPLTASFNGAATFPPIFMSERGTYFISEVRRHSDLRHPQQFQLAQSRPAAPKCSARWPRRPATRIFTNWNCARSWFFKGFGTNHMLEIDGRGGVVSPWDDTPSADLRTLVSGRPL